MSDIVDAQTANSRERRPYGFDCEYKAFPVPGRTALVQLSNPSKVLLVQVSSFKGIVASIEDCNSAEVILGFPDRLKVNNPANIYARHLGLTQKPPGYSGRSLHQEGWALYRR